jgi:hypothetical protein
MTMHVMRAQGERIMPDLQLRIPAAAACALLYVSQVPDCAEHQVRRRMV